MRINRRVSSRSMKTMESTAAKMYLSDIELVLKNALSTSVWILPDQVVAICGVST